MRSALRSVALPLLAAAALAVPLRWAALRTLSAMGADAPYDVRYVPQGRALGFLSEDLRLSIANYYWLQTVQYVGEPRAKERGWDQLFPLLDLVTDLDPRHGYAFQTGGIVLSSQLRLEESDRILKKGIDRGPNWWSYAFYIAFNDYFYRGDYESAARWAEVAARTPGASTNIAHLALSLKVKSGDPDDAVHFLEEMLGAAKDEATTAALEEQYRLAVLQRDFARLDAAVDRFQAERARAPRDLREVVAAGLLDAVPPEPFGGRYYLDPKDGRVHSSARDHRFKTRERGRLEPTKPAATPDPTP